MSVWSTLLTGLVGGGLLVVGLAGYLVAHLDEDTRPGALLMDIVLIMVGSGTGLLLVAKGIL